MEPVSVLILCTGNSARSILAEALVTHLGHGRLRGHSAGSRPNGRVNPLALETLARHGVPIADARSKSWDEFAAPDAPPIDIVITVCDSAAAETCPVWPGHPAQAHWGIPDPAAVAGPREEQLAAFEAAYQVLSARIAALAALPLDHLAGPELVQELRQIAARFPTPGY